MDFSHYSKAPIDFAVDLANTSPHLFDEPDDIGTAAELAAFLGERGLEVGTGMSDIDLEEFRRVRDQVVRVFDAVTEEDAAAAINELLATVEAVPQVSNHDGATWHLHYSPLRTTPARRAASAAGMALATVLCESGLERFGRCSHDRCVDYFIDTSKNSSRRYCSDKCTNRAGIEAYRARQRTGSKE